MKIFLWQLSVRRFFSNIPLLICIAVILAISSVVYTAFTYGYAKKSGELQSDTTIYIPKGTGSSGIIDILANNKVITYPKLFFIMYHAVSGEKFMKAGEYHFYKHTTPWKVLNKMLYGKVSYRSVTFPEGLTTAEIIKIIQNTDGFSGELPEYIEEGSLFPSTYLFSYNDTKEYFITRMKNKRSEILNELWEERSKNLGFIDTKQQAIILASIVEKEAAVDEERGRIAAVFLNRLKKGMKLQSDPTVIYAITKGKAQLNRSLTRKDLKFQSPFNTYVTHSLPPEPICNPGKSSIEAVLNPPETDEFYFVASENGRHSFSKTLREHIKNVRKYRASNQ